MGKKRCNRGKSCGMTCIQSRKACRKDLVKGTSLSLVKVSKEVTNLKFYSGSPSPSQGSSSPKAITDTSKVKTTDAKVEELVKLGNEAIGRHKEIEEGLRVFKEINRAKEKIDEERKKLGGLSVVRKLQLKKRRLELLAQEVKAEFKLMRAMEGLREEMLVPKVSQDLLNRLVGRVSITGIDEANLGRVQGALMEFARMFNGRGLGDMPVKESGTGERLREIARVPSSKGNPRPYAIPAVGAVFLPNNASKSEIFHEIGHILESQSSSTLKFSEKWRNDKALSTEEIRKIYPGIPVSNVQAAAGISLPAVKLLYMEPEFYKDPREVALVDKYMNRYLGKVYPGGGTEVISIAIESFADSGGMSTLAKSHPDLFAYVVGMSMAD